MKDFLLASILLCCLFAACENKVARPPAPAFDEQKEQEAIMAAILQETECFYKHINTAKKPGSWKKWAENGKS